jgi:NADH:ubiquinone oxidoreductase subunit E
VRAYPIEGATVAKSAVLEVEVTLTVHAQLEAESATPEELRRFVERESEMVRSAVARAIRHTYREAGWLDEDRSVFVTDLFEVEPAKTEHERGMHGDVVTVCR